MFLVSPPGPLVECVAFGSLEKDMTQLPVSTVLVGEELTEKDRAVAGGEPQLITNYWNAVSEGG